eukprot:4842134-Pyramimonas_sp.AAC.1
MMAGSALLSSAGRAACTALVDAGAQRAGPPLLGTAMWRVATTHLRPLLYGGTTRPSSSDAQPVMTREANEHVATASNVQRKAAVKKGDL